MKLISAIALILLSFMTGNAQSETAILDGFVNSNVITGGTLTAQDSSGNNLPDGSNISSGDKIKFFWRMNLSRPLRLTEQFRSILIIRWTVTVNGQVVTTATWNSPPVWHVDKNVNFTEKVNPPASLSPPENSVVTVRYRIFTVLVDGPLTIDSEIGDMNFTLQ